MKNASFHAGLLLLAAALVYGAPATAQDDRDRRRDQGRQVAVEPDAEEDAGRGREGGIPRAQVEPGDEQEGTEEGLPELRSAPGERRVAPYFLPPDRQRWRLGVFAHNTDTGVVITRVLPGSAARRAGLERGDRIVTVGGYQVGWVEDRLYPLGAELQRQAGRRGDVNLLVQNVRNDRLLNIHLQLDRVR